MTATDSLTINQLIDIYGKSLAFLGVILSVIAGIFLFIWKGVIKSREYQHLELVKKIEANAATTVKGVDEIKEDLKPLTLKVERHEEKFAGFDKRITVVEDWKDGIHERVVTVEQSVKEIVQGYKNN